MISANPALTITAAPRAVELADPYLFRIRDLISAVCGIYHPENKFYFLYDRCTKRARAIGATSLGDYFEALTVRAGRETELRNLLNEVTVGETCFFRNQPQLDALRATILPEIVMRKSKLGFTHLRVWSAGCSTGEEPYTLAMVLLEEMQAQLKGWKIELIASDLNDLSLERARSGTYTDYALRNIPAYYKMKYMRAVREQFQVNDELKSVVTYSRLNLRDDSKMVFMKGVDVVFCCNVLIYFGAQAKRRIIGHFFNNLVPGGYLFLGHAESLFGLNEDFKLVHFPLASGYVKPDRKPL